MSYRCNRGAISLVETVNINRFLCLLTVLFLAGCGAASRPLMPTPNVYAEAQVELFEELPDAFESTLVEMLYVTDRAPETDEDGNLFYGYRRSNSLAPSHRSWPPRGSRAPQPVRVHAHRVEAQHREPEPQRAEGAQHVAAMAGAAAGAGGEGAGGAEDHRAIRS